MKPVVEGRAPPTGRALTRVAMPYWGQCGREIIMKRDVSFDKERRACFTHDVFLSVVARTRTRTPRPRLSR